MSGVGACAGIEGVGMGPEEKNTGGPAREEYHTVVYGMPIIYKLEW